MKKTIEQRLAALCKINNRYHKIIGNDPILKSDFADLMECSDSGDDMAFQHYKKIIAHLIAETDEAAEDTQRMEGESPTFFPDGYSEGQAKKEQRNLKKDLGLYQRHYLEG